MHVGSFEITIANIRKVDRLKTEEVYVCGFIPNYLLPNKASWYLDPFLHPLISDIEDAFINGISCYMLLYRIIEHTFILGISVDYKLEVAGIEPGQAKIRCLILCWTGDHPAQCEVGKFLSSGGIHACRRDKLQGR